MKKFIVMMVGIAMMTLNVFADDPIQVGAFVAFPGAGDVENGEIGGGVQGIVPIGPHSSLELSVSKFGDSLDITSMSILQFCSTFRWNHKFTDTSWFYLGAGLNYNQLTAEISNPNIKVQMENVVGIHGTIGIEKVISKTCSLFLDYRYTKLDTTAVVSGGGMSEVVEGSYDHGLMRAGLNFSF